MNRLKVSTPVIARTVVLVFALTNQVLTMSGWNPLPFSEEDVYTGCTLLLTVVASLVAWWNDNPVTQKALQNIEDIKQLRIDDEQRKRAVKEE
jgi:SPP1 family holin